MWLACLKKVVTFAPYSAIIRLADALLYEKVAVDAVLFEHARSAGTV